MTDRTGFNAYQRDYKRHRYAAIVEEMKTILGGRCCRCGSRDDLEFDHIDRNTKTVEITKITTYSREVILMELAKCQLLCAECHKVKTSEAHDNHQVEHGGGVSGKKNCPCDACRARKREYMREYQQRRRAIRAA